MTGHRDKELDSLRGKRVKIWFKDGDILIGKLCFMEQYNERYALENAFDHKRGFLRDAKNIQFRKSHIKRVEVFR